MTVHLHFLNNRVVINSLLLIKAIRTDLLHLIFKSFDVIHHLIDIFIVLHMVDSLNVMQKTMMILLRIHFPFSLVIHSNLNGQIVLLLSLSLSQFSLLFLAFNNFMWLSTVFMELLILKVIKMRVAHQVIVHHELRLLLELVKVVRILTIVVDLSVSVEVLGDLRVVLLMENVGSA